jgi:hypothetical protein
VSTEPPDELAFLSLFEVEPKKLEAGVSWVYNTSIYEIERDSYLVRFQINPYYSTLKVTLTVGGREVAETELMAFTSLEIVDDSGRETLIARFGELEASAMYLTLKPQVRITTVVGSDS